MSGKEKYNDLISKNEQDYEEYRNLAETANSEAAKKCDEYNQNINLINKERIDLRDQIRELYDFLKEVGGSLERKLSIFDYKMEKMAIRQFTPEILKLNNPYYSVHRPLEDSIAAHIRKHMDNKTMLEKFEVDLEQQKQKYDEDIHKKINYLKEINSAVEIAEIYRNIIVIVRDTIREKIIPELDLIRAFMYADVICEKVIDDETLENLKPCPIIEFQGGKYDIHYQFIKNAFDFYEISTTFFQETILTDILSDGIVTNQEKEEFSTRIQGIKDSIGCIDKVRVTNKDEQ